MVGRKGKHSILEALKTPFTDFKGVISSLKKQRMFLYFGPKHVK